MTAQVVPMFRAEDFVDYHTYIEMGWKGVLFAIVAAAILFGILKGKVGFVSVGPSEAGIRELFGVRLWRIGPGPHLNLEGFWKARKASVAIIEVDLTGEYPSEGYTKQYTTSVWLRVQDTKQALIAHMYRAQDLARDNMENSEAVKQATSLLKRNLRVLLEAGADAAEAETQLENITHKVMLEKYGYVIDEVLVTELTARPQSELAKAITNANGPLGAAAVAAEESDGRAHLEVVSE